MFSRKCLRLSSSEQAGNFVRRVAAWLLALLVLLAACGIIDQVSSLGSNVGRLLGKGIN